MKIEYRAKRWPPPRSQSLPCADGRFAGAAQQAAPLPAPFSAPFDQRRREAASFLRRFSVGTWSRPRTAACGSTQGSDDRGISPVESTKRSRSRSGWSASRSRTSTMLDPLQGQRQDLRGRPPRQRVRALCRDRRSAEGAGPADRARHQAARSRKGSRMVGVGRAVDRRRRGRGRFTECRRCRSRHHDRGGEDYTSSPRGEPRTGSSRFRRNSKLEPGWAPYVAVSNLGVVGQSEGARRPGVFGETEHPADPWR